MRSTIQSAASSLGPLPRRLTLSVCLVFALWFGGRAVQRFVAPPAQAAASGRVLQPIESIRVGQRLVADDPDVELPERTQVDPATWSKVTAGWHC